MVLGNFRWATAQVLMESISLEQAVKGQHNSLEFSKVQLPRSFKMRVVGIISLYALSKILYDRLEVKLSMASSFMLRAFYVSLDTSFQRKKNSNWLQFDFHTRIFSFCHHLSLKVHLGLMLFFILKNFSFYTISPRRLENTAFA